jgi:secondary thiamine-phosphate synthase enzyme
MQSLVTIQTRGQGLYEFTEKAVGFVGQSDIDQGLLTIFVRHTSCSLLIQENADLDVQVDLNEFFKRLVPNSNDPSMRWVSHVMEGPDDMPAHIKASMMPVSLSIPISDGRLVLGTWQGIYLFDHRTHPHTRQVVLDISG